MSHDLEGSEPIVIRSYRSVFRFERRLYRIDRWRLPLRSGLPLRAFLYAPMAYLGLLLAGRLPVIGPALDLLPAPLHWLLLPAAAVAAALRAQVEGRPTHRALWSYARWALGPRWLAGLRRCSPPSGHVVVAGVLVVRPDTCSGAYRRGRVAGPARVLLRGPAELVPTRSRRRLALASVPGPPLAAGRVLELPARSELVIR